MSTLCIVRHGQASAHAADYDRLSPLGEEQGRALGEYWAQTGQCFDRVYLGPLRRHRQTLAAVDAVFRRRGIDWPQPTPLPELAEHQGPEVIAHHRAHLYRTAELVDPDHEEVDRQEKMRRYLIIYQQGTRRWIRDDLETPAGLEPWAAFRARIESAAAKILAADTPGQRAVAFTSGGATAAAVGLALGLDDGKILELSWRVRNAALTRLLFTRGRLSLDTFNTTPHLREDRLVTYI